MSCRFLLFRRPTPMEEWVPMALREAICLRRKSDPERWNRELARHGVPVEPGDVRCLHNATGTWERCPLYMEVETGTWY